ncbi:MAG: hypothetical protein ABIT01_19625, partial [Thermoanaerobaculia bacterium]
ASGGGVVETFKLVSKLTFVDLLRRLQRGGSIERDLFGSPEVAAQALDPSENTSVRAGGGPPERRSSFSAASVSVAAPPPEAPAESPFDASTSWLRPAADEIFSDTAPASVAAAPPAAESDPFAESPRESRRDPDTLPGTEAVASGMETEIPEPQAAPSESFESEAFSLPAIDSPTEAVDLAPAPASDAALTDAPVTEAPAAEASTAADAAPDSAPEVESADPGQEHAAFEAAGDAPAIDASTGAEASPEPEPEPESSTTDSLAFPADEVPSEEEALSVPDTTSRDDQSLRSEIETALAGLRAELHAMGERMEKAELSAGEALEQIRGELKEALHASETSRTASEQSQSTAREENARERDILSGSMRVVESAQGALSQRMASLEGEIGRIATSSDESHRHTSSRLEAVDQRTKKLAESIRKALDTLND